MTDVENINEVTGFDKMVAQSRDSSKQELFNEIKKKIKEHDKRVREAYHAYTNQVVIRDDFIELKRAEYSKIEATYKKIQ